MAFYMTKRTDEKQCTVGERCMLLADFYGPAAGDKGVVVDISTHDDHSGGVSVRWRKKGDGSISTADFSREELEYLAFETRMHPEVNPAVTREEV